MEDEYLITNQLGGYSSATFHKGNTRKYHGLLVAANENLDRYVVVSQLEEKIHNDVTKFFSTSTFFPDFISPDGSKYLKRQSIKNSTVCFEYDIDGVKIFKEVSLAQESNTVIVRYKIINDHKLHFTVSPLITHRAIDSLARYSDATKFTTTSYLNNAKVALSANEELVIKVLSFNPKNLLNVSYGIKSVAHVYQNYYYPEEAVRGYESVEDLIKPLEIAFNIEPGESFISVQFNYRDSNESLGYKVENALKLVYNLDYRKKEIVHTPLIEFKDFLQARYRDFLIDSAGRKSIIAGYHWFGDWGRDAFISLPGLLLTTGEYGFAKEVITFWGKYIKDGLIPNSLSNSLYNSIDAPLWYIVSIYRYYEFTKDKLTVKAWLPKVKNIIIELANGSGFSIKLDNNGFLVWDDPKHNLTWMDSQVANKSTTGRIGACVEIQMLWYNALKIYEYLCKETGSREPADEITALAKKVNQKFNKHFWNEKLDYAYDYIDENGPNAEIRPNVVLGLSLPYKLFDKKKTEIILNRILKDLYTEAGLATLNKTDAKYNGFYKGTETERDMAYHNGTTWPFLLGFYMKAVIQAYPKDVAKQQEVKSQLVAFWGIIKKRNLNYLPEVFSSHDLSPSGCISQAWNYALFLEVYHLLNS